MSTADRTQIDFVPELDGPKGYVRPARPLGQTHRVTRPAHPDIVIQLVCESYCVTREQLLGTERHQSVAEARLTAYWLLRRCTNKSYPEIARVMNRLDHTTVMSGVKKREAARERDPEFRRYTEGLVEMLERVVAA